MAHWQLSPVERALERPAGGTARETGTPFREWREALLTTSPGSANRHKALTAPTTPSPFEERPPSAVRA
jgi:hypothetical protein